MATTLAVRQRQSKTAQRSTASGGSNQKVAQEQVQAITTDTEIKQVQSLETVQTLMLASVRRVPCCDLVKSNV